MPRPKVARYKSLQERLKKNSKSKKCKISGCGRCGIWTGYTVNGYGRTNIRVNGVNKTHFVHRIAKVLDEILTIYPDFDIYNKSHKPLFHDLYRAYNIVKLTIDHVCGDSLCINPDHLEWVWLDKNVQRKKWCDRKRSDRISMIESRVTRQVKALATKKDISHLVKDILRKRYRRKSFEKS